MSKKPKIKDRLKYLKKIKENNEFEIVNNQIALRMIRRDKVLDQNPELESKEMMIKKTIDSLFDGIAVIDNEIDEETHGQDLPK